MQLDTMRAPLTLRSQQLSTISTVVGTMARAGLRGKRLGAPIRAPDPGPAALLAHASALGTLAVHQFLEWLAPSTPGTPLCATAAAHHRRQHRLG